MGQVWSIGSAIYVVVWRILIIPRDIVKGLSLRQFSVTGRYAHADRLYPISVRGSVRDAATDQPLSGVLVTFLDTGLDSRRSSNPEKWSRDIGQSDGQGQIAADLRYMWSVLVRDHERLPEKRAVRIRLRSVGYQHANVDFDFAQITPDTEGQFVLNLGVVRLDKT